jgi:methyl-accepting chemotaxis protein
MNVFKNARIGTKMTAGFLVVAGLFVVVAVTGFVGMKNINDALTLTYTDGLVPIRDVATMKTQFYDLRGEMFKFILLPDERAASEQMISGLIDSVNAYRGDYANTPLSKEEAKELPNFDRTWATYRGAVADVLAWCQAGNEKEAIASLSTGGAVFNARVALAASLDKLMDINVAIANGRSKGGNRTFAGATLVTVLLGAFAVILAVVIGVALTRSITGPITTLSRLMTRVASRDDLAAAVPATERKDEVGALTQAFRLMLENLRRSTVDASESQRLEAELKTYRGQLEKKVEERTAELTGVLKDMQEAVNVLAATSSEIMAATTQVASGTAQSATAISETTATVEEVRQAARLSSDKAKNVADSAQRVAQISQSGQEAVEETAADMLHIRNQVESITQTVIRLSEQSQLIGDITASVTDLADQSNLLAVNASIEAARAGEQGRGFAVVAQEIRNLAEQSKQATAQVRAILNDVQKATSIAVTATEQGSKAVEAGVKQSAQAGEVTRALAENTVEVLQAVTQIVASSQQQVIGMDQVGAAMESLNQAGAQTAVSMQQVATAAQNLHELGQKLKRLVERGQA